MRLVGVAVYALLLANGALAESWASRYAQARAGYRRGREWRGRGTLINTVTGNHIADVEFGERCTQSSTSSTAAFSSERVLLYRAADGRQLATFSGRPVPVLRYAHNVSVELANGGLQLRAVDGAGRVVASAHGLHRTVRAGLRRGLELSVRPSPRDTAIAAPSPPAVPGTARAAVQRPGATREEYRLLQPACPGGSCTLRYRRTGRCPSWYGAGLCTLHVEARTKPLWTRWWHRVCRCGIDNLWEESINTK